MPGEHEINVKDEPKTKSFTPDPGFKDKVVFNPIRTSADFKVTCLLEDPNYNLNEKRFIVTRIYTANHKEIVWRGWKTNWRQNNGQKWQKLKGGKWVTIPKMPEYERLYLKHKKENEKTAD